MPIFFKNKVINWIFTGIISAIGLAILSIIVYSFKFVPKVNFFMQDQEKRVTKIEEDYVETKYVDDKYDILNSAIMNTNTTVKDYTKEDRAFKQELLKEIYKIKYGNNKNSNRLNEALKNLEEAQHVIEPMKFKTIEYLPIDSNITLNPNILDTMFVDSQQYKNYE
jgi:hypothetical protein